MLSYNVAEPNWEKTVWGIPPEKPGRLVKAATVMLDEDPDMVIITGGAGQKDGRSEAWWMRKRLYDGLDELDKFTAYPILQRFSGDQTEKRLNEILVLEETAKNTAENLQKTGEMFAKAGIEKVIIVTSPDHVSRAIRDAIQYWSRDYPKLARNVYATASATFYSARTPEDEAIARMENVVIAEPPAMNKFNLARIFGIMGNPDALAELNTLLQKYGK